MSRVSVFTSPLFLGFEPLERLLDQTAKPPEGYPPYNIERFAATESQTETWCITLAVAGFADTDLEIAVEESQLVIRGRQPEETQQRDYMHRGIAGRAFTRSFVLAESMQVQSAELANGLLAIKIIRTTPQRRIIPINGFLTSRSDP
jgi:HSP20 family molecular chaperone IbpA